MQFLADFYVLFSIGELINLKILEFKIYYASLCNFDLGGGEHQITRVVRNSPERYDEPNGYFGSSRGQ